MKKVLLVILCDASLFLVSQDGYEYHCTPGINHYPEFALMGHTTVEVYFNDPDGDCISDDFFIIFRNEDGADEFWEGVPGHDDPIDFGEQDDCCNDDITGNEGNGVERCSWEVIDGDVVITCPTWAE